MKIFGKKTLLRESPIRLSEGWVAEKLRLSAPEKPAFVIGCGRSGTTILGKSLQQHPQICYLNEQRHLWYSCYPETDISTKYRDQRNGRLFMTAADTRDDATLKLHSLFKLQCIKYHAPQLVDKLPVNSLRISFIKAIFPDARFIHIVRDGREVARSITKKLDRGSWFAKNPIKWAELQQLGREQLHLDVDRLCIENYDKALLEWAVNTHAVVTAMDSGADEDFMEVSYQSFIDEPIASIRRCIDFLGLDQSSKVENYVAANVRRRNKAIKNIDFSDQELAIAGTLLHRYANA